MPHPVSHLLTARHRRPLAWMGAVVCLGWICASAVLATEPLAPLTRLGDAAAVPIDGFGPEHLTQPPADADFLPVRMFQADQPLLPADPLRPGASDRPNTSDNLLEPRNMAQGRGARGSARLVSQSRVRAPSMIGDFFGAVSGEPSLVPGEIIARAVTVDELSYLQTIDPSVIPAASTGRLFATADGGLLVGEDEDGDGFFDVFTNLAEYSPDVFGRPGSALGEETFVGLFEGETLLIPPSVVDVDDPARVYNIRPLIEVDIPGVGAGGPGSQVGRIKLSENASPLPRDRFFFNYSLFTNVPLTRNGIDINRFVPGWEKTFFDGQMSLEARMPFAATLSEDIEIGGGTSVNDLVFGNVTTTLKGIIYEDDAWVVSLGLQVQLPTAPDLRVWLPSRRELVRVENQSVHLMPVLAGLYTPSERLFFQGFVQTDIDTNGNTVQVFNRNTGLTPAGRSQDSNYIYTDISGGWWVYLDDTATGRTLSGLAPTLELHHNRSLKGSDPITSGGFQIGHKVETYEMLTAVAGLHMVFAQGSTLTVGYTVPLTSGDDRVFDGEVRVMLNHYFGTTRARTAGSY